MKSFFFYIACMLIVRISSFAQCVNGDFETGNFTNYSFYSGGRFGPGPVDVSTLFPATPGVSSSCEIVTLANTDNWFPTQLQTVHQGTYAARVGVDNAGGFADMMGYSFLVTNQNKFFSFRGAIVLNYSDEHPMQDEQAYVQYFMCRGTVPSLDPANVLTVANAQRTVYATDIPAQWDGYYLEGGTNGTSFLEYKNWTKYCIDLSPYVGQVVSIFFLSVGCTQMNHPGYWYIDEVCGTAPPVASFNMLPFPCYYSLIAADGTSSINDEDHQWTIEQLNIPSNTVVTGNTVTNTFLNTPAGFINLGQMYNAAGKAFTPGGRYRITLGVRFNCITSRGTPNPFPWVTTSIIIDIPPLLTVDAGPDVYFCCSSAPASAQLGSAGNNPAFQFQWNIENGPLVSTLPRPVVSPPKSTTYVVTMTSGDGCVATDKVKFIYKTLPNVTVTETCIGSPCYKQLGLNLLFPVNTDPNVPACQGDSPGYDPEKTATLTYLWNEGQTTAGITSTPGTTYNFKFGMKAYNVTVSNGCGSTGAGIIVNTYNGPIPTLAIPDAFSPNGNGINDVFYILEQGSPMGAANSYNAYRGEFRIYNRGGQEIRTVIVENCGTDGLTNGVFSWDGSYQGVQQPIDNYVFQLILYNCDHPNGVVTAGNIILFR